MPMPKTIDEFVMATLYTALPLDILVSHPPLEEIDAEERKWLRDSVVLMFRYMKTMTRNSLDLNHLEDQLNSIMATRIDEP